MKVIKIKTIKKIINIVCFPLRVACSHNLVEKLGLVSIRQERMDMVRKYCTGRLLDIGCGGNELVKEYGQGTGVDVHNWEGVDLVVEDTSNLPFKDKEFDTVSFVTSLHHIPYREKALEEAHRLLKDDGVLLITMIQRRLGALRHMTAWWDRDLVKRGMKEGEVDGIDKKDVIKLVNDAGFDVIRIELFCLGLNRLYVCKKKGGIEDYKKKE